MKKYNIQNMLFQHNLFLQGKKEKRIEYTNMLTKSRPDLKNIQDIVQEIINIPDSVLSKAILFWTNKGTLTPPYNYQKLSQVMNILRIKRADFQNYESPEAVLQQQEEIVNSRPINPDTCPQLTHKVQLGNGVTVYNVQNDRQGQEKMRQIINTHAGVKSNPWCLLHGDGKGNLSDGSNGSYDARYYWNHYNDLTKRVAFQNGKLIAFSANDSSQLVWWDMQDHPHTDIPCKGTPVFDKEGYQAMPPDLSRSLMLRSPALSNQKLTEMLNNATDAKSQYNLALNPKITSEQLQTLSKSQYAYVRLAVAQNKKTPQNILKTLSTDQNVLVARYARFNLDPSLGILAQDVWTTIFGLPPEEIFILHYKYADHPNITATRRCQMHQNVNVLGTGVSTINAHAAWNNIKYWDLDRLAYRSCKIPNIIWIQIQGVKRQVIHNQPNITAQSKFNSIFNILKHNY